MATSIPKSEAPIVGDKPQKREGIPATPKSIAGLVDELALPDESEQTLLRENRRSIVDCNLRGAGMRF